MTTTVELLNAKYGPTLGYAQLAEVLKVSIPTLRNQHSAGELKVKTFKLGKARVAHVEDVSQYIDELRAADND